MALNPCESYFLENKKNEIWELLYVHQQPVDKAYETLCHHGRMWIKYDIVPLERLKGLLLTVVILGRSDSERPSASGRKNSQTCGQIVQLTERPMSVLLAILTVLAALAKSTFNFMRPEQRKPVPRTRTKANRFTKM